MFGINRRYYHWEATGDAMWLRQLKAAVRTPWWAVGLPATCSHLLVPRERAFPPVRAHPQGDFSNYRVLSEPLTSFSAGHIGPCPFSVGI